MGHHNYASICAGHSYKVINGITYPSVIGYNTVATNSGRITGLAVQKTGNFLFVARAGLNQLIVSNKTTGALVQSIAMVRPRSICVDAGNNLWVVTGTNKVSKYFFLPRRVSSALA